MSEEQSPFPENTASQHDNAQNTFDSSFPGEGHPFHFQMALPNATAVLVLGILSLVTCCCYGVFGLLMAVIALVLAAKDRKRYMENPSVYSMSSFKNLNAGRVCALIGVILSALVALFYIGLIMVFGLSVFSNPDALREALGSMQ